MATFFNQATLIFEGAQTLSNITEGAVNSTLTITKAALSLDYERNSLVSYLITITNPTGSTREGVIVNDNLGTFSLGDELITPLDYVDGSAILLTDGVSAPLGATATEGTLTFDPISIAANSSVNIIFTARVNELAPLDVGSTIENTASTECIDEGATAEVGVRSFTSLTIAKAVCPMNVSCGERISYTFIIQNTGNTPASDGLIVSDTFTPQLTDLIVTLDGEPFPATSYTYDEISGVFTTAEGEITVPAAAYTVGEGGVISTTPGVAVLTVSGIIS